MPPVLMESSDEGHSRTYCEYRMAFIPAATHYITNTSLWMIKTLFLAVFLEQIIANRTNREAQKKEEKTNNVLPL